MNNSRKSLNTLLLFIHFFCASLFLQVNAQTEVNSASIKPEIANNIACETLSDKYVFLHGVVLDDFIKEINGYGKCGYRVAQVARYMIEMYKNERQMKFYAILERNVPAQYEYAWFFAYTPGEAQTLSNKYAAENFYFRLKFSFTSGVNINQKSDSEESTAEKIARDLGILGNEQRGAFFLFERKVGSSIKKEYKILDGRVSGEKGEMAGTNKTLNDYVAKGFRPLDLWFTGFTTQNLVIVEKDEAIKPEGEYLMIYQTLGLNKKMTELGREGFAPISIGFVFALLQRTKKQPTNEVYETVQTWKEIEKRIPKWKESGIKYIDTGISDYYTNYDPFDGKWLFAFPEKNNPEYGKNKDFIFVRYASIAEKYYKTNGLKPTEKNPLTPQQYKEINDIFSKEINELGNKDYRLVSLGYPNSLVAIFEKRQRAG